MKLTKEQIKAIKWFVEEVNRKAEEKMLKTFKLEGAHKASMDELFREIQKK